MFDVDFYFFFQSVVCDVSWNMVLMLVKWCLKCKNWRNLVSVVDYMRLMKVMMNRMMVMGVGK